MRHPLLVLALVCSATSAGAQEAAQEAAKEEEAKPFTAEVSLTQFVQGPVTGGVGSDLDYGGRFDVELKFDPSQLGWWENGTFEAKVVTRYGDAANGQVGALSPVNTALIHPAASGTEIAISALNYTHLIPLDDPGDMVALGIGRYDALDLVTEAFIGGSGITKWMNTAQAAPLHELRNLPTLTPYAFTAALILAGEPRASFAVLDPFAPTLESGLDDLFSNGVTLLGSAILPTSFFGKAGHHELRVTWNDSEVLPFSQIPRLLLPPTLRNLDPVSSSWTIGLLGDQYLSENPGPPRTGWGLFWALGIGDPESNPIPLFVNLGFGGTSPFTGRMRDSAGLAFGYIALSDDLDDALDPLVEIGDEWEAELYYALAFTEWCVLTADLQLVRPFRANVDATLVPGARLQLVF